MRSSAAELDQALRSVWMPVMKADGFRVSGRNARRVRNGWIQVVNVQLEREGHSFAVNLGLQPEDQPEVTGQCPDPKILAESACVFRRRLTEGGEDQWWSLTGEFGDDAGAVREMISVYQRVGAPLLERVGGLGCPFDRATVADLEQGGGILSGFDFIPVKIALNLARIRRSAGRFREARELAQFGLARLGRATALQSELEELSRLGD